MTTYIAALDNSKTNVEGHSKFLGWLVSPGIPTNFSSTSMAVVQRGAGANMSVDVSIGQAVLERPTQDYTFVGWQDAVTNVPITTADPTNPRITTIVSLCDTSVTNTSLNNSPGALKFQAINGTAAGSPTAPSDSTIQTTLGSTVAWKRLADVTVPANASSIVTANIADKRTAISSRISSFVDVNGNSWLLMSSTASAVNQITIANAATGNGPTISATGSDTNIDLNFSPKGTGQVKGVVDHLYNPYKFNVYRNTNQTVTSNTWTKIQCNSKTFDTSTNYDAVTNFQFTATVAGFYFFIGAVSGASIAVGGTVAAGINVGTFSATPTYQGIVQFSGGSGGNPESVVSAFTQLTAGQTVQLYGYISSTTVIGTSTSSPSYLQGFLVSAT